MTNDQKRHILETVIIILMAVVVIANVLLILKGRQ